MMDENSYGTNPISNNGNYWDELNFFNCATTIPSNVSGYVYVDQNCNGDFDGLDNILSNWVVNWDNGYDMGYVETDSNGYYFIEIPPPPDPKLQVTR